MDNVANTRSRHELEGPGAEKFSVVVQTCP